LQNREKMLISKAIGKNGSVKELMQCFSSPASRRRSNPVTPNGLLRFATASLVMTLVFDLQHYL